MELTAVQQDALVELLNIGFGRAAASLSQLTGHRVLLEVPQVTLHAIDEVGDALERVVQRRRRQRAPDLHRPGRRRRAADPRRAGAAILKELLTNEPALPLSIDASAREVITEVGNILLNACLGTFGNLLKVQVSFSVPHLSIENVGAILESLRVNHEGHPLRAGRPRRIPAARHAGDRLPGDRPERRVARSADPRRRGLGAVAVTEHDGRRRRRSTRWPRVLRWFEELDDRGVFTTDESLIVRALEPLAGGADRPAAPATVVGRPLFELFPVAASSAGSTRYYRDALGRRSAACCRERFHKFLLPITRNFHGAGLTEMAQSARIEPLVDGERDHRHDHADRGRDRARHQRARAAQPDRRVASGRGSSPRKRRG